MNLVCLLQPVGEHLLGRIWIDPAHVLARQAHASSRLVLLAPPTDQDRRHSTIDFRIRPAKKIGEDRTASSDADREALDDARSILADHFEGRRTREHFQRPILLPDAGLERARESAAIDDDQAELSDRRSMSHRGSSPFGAAATASRRTRPSAARLLGQTRKAAARGRYTPAR